MTPLMALCSLSISTHHLTNTRVVFYYIHCIYLTKFKTPSQHSTCIHGGFTFKSDPWSVSERSHQVMAVEDVWVDRLTDTNVKCIGG